MSFNDNTIDEKPFTCVLVGGESLLAECAQMLRRRGHAIAAIVSDAPAIAAFAQREGIRHLGWEGGIAARLEGIDYDWLFSIANLRIIPAAVYGKARRGAVNFHDGPLPRYAGLNAPSFALLAGETRYGVSWHAITEGVDEGDIYEQRSFEIAPDETALTLNSRCFEAGIASFEALIDAITTDTLRRTPQDLSGRTYFARGRKPEALGTLRFERTTEDLQRLARALDFGPGYLNPLAVPKLRTVDGVYAVTRLMPAEVAGPAPAGTVLTTSGSDITIATADGAVRIEGRCVSDGTPLPGLLRPGTVLPLLSDSDAQALDTAAKAAGEGEDRFRARLAAARDVELMDVVPPVPGVPDVAEAALDLPEDLSRDDRIAAVSAFLLRISGQRGFSVAFADDAISRLAARFPDDFSDSVPLRLDATGSATSAELKAQVAAELSRLRGKGSPLADLPLRVPHLAAPSLTVGLVEADAPDQRRLPRGCAFAVVLGAGADALLFDRRRISARRVADLATRLAFLSRAFAAGAAPLGELPLMDEDERHRVLFDWNDTARAIAPATLSGLFEQQADRTPDAVAVAAGARTLTYRQLDARANRVAHALAARGVGPDVMVGLHVSRTVDLVVGALAIHKAGGAYVPLDPDFPADRLALMVEDSAAPLVLTERALKGTLPSPAETLAIEDLAATGPQERLPARAAPENLAYVIYTSGSTGRPKGVMIEHRNVVNFFAGMDERIARGTPGEEVWLAVTSLSFDISVLELFWTLTRGFKVVIHARTAHAGPPLAPARTKAVDFGLFYWGNDDGAGPAKYRLLLEGAKFADAHGFTAVWTPERHFHAFGGPYPNPAVTGAAVAAVTKNLSIRAGSCVLPLHHPARVAEDWAVLDNIANGRVGLAVASGWMPEDFVLRPQNAPPHNKAALLRDVETVRRLWRGEAVAFPLDGKEVEVVTQPRPVQKELPVWITTAGNPDTWREAARMGAHVLTHLLGQSIAEVAEKIALYREALREAGRDPAEYKVTLMLHTLLGADRAEVRDRARGPMKEYLRSAAALIKQYAWAFPAFKKPAGVSNPEGIDLTALDAEEMDAILEFAFLRYFEDSGLFGTVEDAVRRVDEVAAIGVDEIACLIDFGVETGVVLERLKPLAEVAARAREVAEPEPAPCPLAAAAGFAAEVRAHKVTHLQCTPSMARMFLMDEADRAALADISHLFIGGEALPGALVKSLRDVTSASIENMYGPTETTIWSSTATVGAPLEVIPLGRPIANTQFYVLDAEGHAVPPGYPGELCIGGDGVARGYHARPELTAERFGPNPFAPGRIYRTGDSARFSADGTLNFLGRLDHQVKVRGYRIELGEIEARLAEFETVAEAVAVVRNFGEDDARIVAYLRPAPGARIDEAALRAHLQRTLPDYMVPAHMVTLAVFPLTPNAKVDRKALPMPQDRAQATAYVAPQNELEKEIAETFRRILRVERVGLGDSFFALGGHSLLAVQAHRELKAKVAPQMAITDLFRFPVVAALAAHLADRSGADAALGKAAERAAQRRAALGDRRAALTRSRGAG